MNCDRCNTAISPGDERKHLGQTLCEDCYMIALSPMRTCDPWAVHSAKTFEQHNPRKDALTPIQSEILSVLKENGPMAREALLDELGGKIDRDQLERAFATLRHMEKVRAEKKDGVILLRLW